MARGESRGTGMGRRRWRSCGGVSTRSLEATTGISKSMVSATVNGPSGPVPSAGRGESGWDPGILVVRSH
jgi:hypothetical protein